MRAEETKKPVVRTPTHTEHRPSQESPSVPKLGSEKSGSGEGRIRAGTSPGLGTQSAQKLERLWPLLPGRSDLPFSHISFLSPSPPLSFCFTPSAKPLLFSLLFLVFLLPLLCKASFGLLF